MSFDLMIFFIPLFLSCSFTKYLSGAIVVFTMKIYHFNFPTGVMNFKNPVQYPGQWIRRENQKITWLRTVFVLQRWRDKAILISFDKRLLYGGSCVYQISFSFGFGLVLFL